MNDKIRQLIKDNWGYIFYIAVFLFYTCAIYQCGKRNAVKSDNEVIKTTTRIVTSTDKLPKIISTKPLYFFKFAKNEAGIKKVEHHFREVRKMVAGKSETSSRAQEDDSISVPITQSVYKGDSYTAYVSGFHQQLDSISIREKIITNTIVKKRSRWNLGICAGYACTPQGLSPYVGVGIIYNIFR